MAPPAHHPARDTAADVGAKFPRPVRAAILLLGGGGLWAAIAAAIWAR